MAQARALACLTHLQVRLADAASSPSLMQVALMAAGVHSVGGSAVWYVACHFLMYYAREVHRGRHVCPVFGLLGVISFAAMFIRPLHSGTCGLPFVGLAVGWVR